MAELSSKQAGLAQLAGRAALSTSLVTVGLVLALIGLGQLMALQVGFVRHSLAMYLVAIVAFACLLPAHLPHRVFGLANQVTLVRLAMVSSLAGLVGETGAPVAWLVTAIVLLVVMLDGVDGWAARRTGMSSEFGARFDMETDALLILLLAVLVWQFDKAGAWILAAGLARYGFVAAGMLHAPLRGRLPQSRRRKIVCVVQTLSLVLAVNPLLDRPSSSIIAFLGLAALVYSFSMDIRWLLRR